MQEASLHDAADEEIDTMGIPVGWRECPAMGKPIFRFIPMKVPLGPHFDKIAENDRFTVQDAMLMAKSMLKDVYVDVPVEEDPSKPPEGLG